MNKEEQVKKLKSAVIVFNIFKFVGLAVLIISGILISFYSYEYLIVFFKYLQGVGSSTGVSSAAFDYLGKLFKTLIVLLLGLAALITFNILKNRKAKALADIKQKEVIKEAVDEAINNDK